MKQSGMLERKRELSSATPLRSRLKATHQAKEPIIETKPSRLLAPPHEMSEHPITVQARKRFFCHLT
jgi:hypothetical protein